MKPSQIVIGIRTHKGGGKKNYDKNKGCLKPE